MNPSKMNTETRIEHRILIELDRLEFDWQKI